MDDRRSQRAGVLDVAVALVVLDDDDIAPLGPQPFQDPQPDRAEADEDDVALHPVDAALAQRLLDPAADQGVGDQRQYDGAEGDAGDDQEGPEDLHLGRLLGEGEVAEPDRGEGLDREVERLADREGMVLDKASMQFSLDETEYRGDTLEAYERLIRDAMAGDHTLFTTAKDIERLWAVSAPLIETPPSVEPYPVGSWGPPSIERLIAPNEWRLPFARRWRETPGSGNGAGA